jgi:hypothetical protein
LGKNTADNKKETEEQGQKPGKPVNKNHRLKAAVIRFLGWWFGFTGLYALFGVCPFCGQPGCAVGAGSAGVVGGFFALCMQNWKSALRFIQGKINGERVRVLGMAKTYNANEIDVGYHPQGYRIDKTASALNRYTRWTVTPEETWEHPRPVCFDSLPEGGWIRTEKFDWNRRS